MNNNKPEWKKTACNLCFVNCGIEMQVGGENNSKILKVRGDKDHPNSKGYICNKAARLDFYQSSPARITQPMRRRSDGSYEQLDWDTAIKEVAGGLKAIKNSYGGERIVYYGGGSQGNHLGGVYGASLRKALGVRYKGSALSQEKTGLAWVFSRMVGGVFHTDIEHAKVVMFAGKNPFMSNGIEQARDFLREIKKDPDRKLIVLDPRRTETSDYADIHLAVRPGRDAWCMAAIVAYMVQQNLLPMDWLQQHTHGYEKVIGYFQSIPVETFADFSGVPFDQIKETAMAITSAESFALEEDLGVQMAPHSTLVTYLNFLTFLLSGHYGRPGTALLVAQFIDVINPDIKPVDEDGYELHRHKLPVTGAPIVAGLFPGNYLAEEILNDHPERPRALIIESSNPVHSLAESESLRKAIRSLELSVTFDITMTETAMECDYVLPAASQYEKWEATFFPRSYPDNFFHLRAPVASVPEGALTEPEIHSRLIDELDTVKPEELRFLKWAAKGGLNLFTLAFIAQLMIKPKLAGIVAYVLYRTLGPTLPKGQEATAAIWGIAQMYSRKRKRQLERIGLTGWRAGTQLYRKIMNSPSGAVIGRSAPQDSFDEIPHKEHKLQLVIGELLDELDQLKNLEPLIATSDDYPFALIAGSRRAYTANCAIRDPKWAKGKDVYALTIHPGDAMKHDFKEGDVVRIETETGQAQATLAFDDRLHPGSISVPNGQGMLFMDAEGRPMETGVFVNKLTSARHRDKFIGTPLHKFVPARLLKVA